VSLCSGCVAGKNSNTQKERYKEQQPLSVVSLVN
jgi:hypothetical protein